MSKSGDLIVQELKKIGLTEKESHIYLTLLQNGPSTVQKLAIGQKITRPTCYRLLEQLLEKGLINRISIPHKQVKRFAAKSPDELLSLLRLRKRQIEEQERELLRMITQLRSTYHQDEGAILSYLHKPEAREIIVDDIVTSSANEIYIWSSHKNPGLDDTAIEGLTATIRARRGSVPIHRITQAKSSKEELPFIGTVVIAHNVNVFTETEIIVINDRHLLSLLINLIAPHKKISKS